MPIDPFHSDHRRISSRQLKLLQARHDRRVKRTTDQQNAQQNDPAQVTAPLTPKTLAEQVAQTTQQQFGPQEQQLANQQHNITDWYAQYQKTLADIQSRQAADYGQVQGNVANAASSSSALDSAERAKTDQAAQADAQARGGRVDPSLSAQAGQASLARNALLNSFGAQIASQGLTARDLSRGLEAAGSKQGIEQHQKTAGDLRDLQAQKGAFAAKTAGELRDSERKYLLEQAAFGLNEQKAQQDAQHQANADATAASKATSDAAAKNKQLALEAKRLRQQGKISQHAYELQVKKLQEATRHDQVGEGISQQNANTSASKGGSSGSSGSGPSSLTPTQARNNRQQLDKAQALVRSKADKINRANSQAAVDELVAKGIPRVLASIAVRQALGLPVGPTLTRQASRLGVHVPQSHVPGGASHPHASSGAGA